MLSWCKNAEVLVNPCSLGKGACIWDFKVELLRKKPSLHRLRAILYSFIPLRLSHLSLPPPSISISIYIYLTIYISLALCINVSLYLSMNVCIYPLDCLSLHLYKFISYLPPYIYRHGDKVDGWMDRYVHPSTQSPCSSLLLH